MFISGLQKLTLLDYPGKVACTIFTGGCNLRCPFCHNATLVKGEIPRLDEEEVFRFLEKRRGILDGVCVTGGEPLLHGETEAFLSRIHEMGFLVKLDTNGCYPDRLESVLSSGTVDYVAMDIKNCREKYPQTVGVKDFDVSVIERSAALVMNGTTEYEFRTTVVEGLHKVEDIRRIGEWLQGAKRYYLQSYVDSGDILAGFGLGTPEPDVLEKMKKAAAWYIPEAKIRGSDD